MSPIETFFGILNRLNALPKSAGAIIFGIPLYGHLNRIFTIDTVLLFPFALALGYVLWGPYGNLYRSAAKGDKSMALYRRHVSLPRKEKILLGFALRLDSQYLTTDHYAGYDVKDKIPFERLEIFLERNLGTINNGIFSFKEDYWKWLKGPRCVKLIKLFDGSDRSK